MYCSSYAQERALSPQYSISCCFSCSCTPAVLKPHHTFFSPTKQTTSANHVQHASRCCAPPTYDKKQHGSTHVNSLFIHSSSLYEPECSYQMPHEVALPLKRFRILTRRRYPAKPIILSPHPRECCPQNLAVLDYCFPLSSQPLTQYQRVHHLPEHPSVAVTMHSSSADPQPQRT